MEDTNSLYPDIVIGVKASLGAEQAELITNLLENVTKDRDKAKKE